MAILYLSEQGSSLHMSGERFLVHKNNETILDLPYFHIERIFLFGNIQLTTQSTHFLLEHAIPCSYFSSRGKFYGILHGVESGNVFLRICQYERYLDYSFRLSQAKTIVRGKISNQSNFLYFFRSNYPSVTINNSISRLNDLLFSLDPLTQISSVMGIEGKASAYYYSCFQEIIRKNFTFVGRNRQPPKDPVNSLLSLSYSMMTNEIFSCLLGSGFDPYIGFLHELSYNRPSLALDLVEEFRVSLDKFVCNLVNLEIFTPEDFKTENGGVFLLDESRKEYFQQYEKYLSKSSLRKIMKNQIQALMKTIQQLAIYTPYAGQSECIT
jgi:CRISPR-associated protein Cas1